MKVALRQGDFNTVSGKSPENGVLHIMNGRGGKTCLEQF
jgi:hypothetical protein